MLPQRLRQARKAKKMTQAELAQRLNTRKTTISNYETGYSSPPNEMLKDIADVLGVQTDYLLGRTDTTLPNKKSDDNVANEESELLGKIRQIAAERGMELTDPEFLKLVDAAMDFYIRMREEHKQ